MFNTDENKTNFFYISIAILGMHNLITNTQFCNIVGSSNGVDQEHFSSKYLQFFVNSNSLLNIFFLNVSTSVVTYQMLCTRNLKFQLDGIDI